MKSHQELLSIISEQDRQALEIFEQAISTCAEKYKQDPTAENRKNWNAAREGFDQEVSRLWLKYEGHEDRFKNIKAVLEYLNAPEPDGAGLKVSQGKLYGDAKKGLLRVQADKSVLRSSLQAYLDNPEAGLTQKAQQDSQSDQEQIRRERSLDIEIKEQKLIKARAEARKEDEAWMRKDDAWLVIAEFMGLVIVQLDRLALTRAPYYCQAVGADLARAEDLVKALADDRAEMFNQIAETEEFALMFEQEAEE